jgi:hypothetical protein
MADFFFSGDLDAGRQGHGICNREDLILDLGRISLFKNNELQPGALEAIAEQWNPISSLADIFLASGSWFESGELVILFNHDVINPPNLLAIPARVACKSVTWVSWGQAHQLL